MNEKDSSRRRRSSPAHIQVPDGGVRILESHHKEEFMMEMDDWPFHKFCWVAMGAGLVEYDKNSSPIRKDDFLLLPAGVQHRFQDDPKDPLTLVMFCISESYFHFDSTRELQHVWKALLSASGPKEPMCAVTAFHHTRLIAGFRSALREQSEQASGWEAMLEAELNRLVVHWTRGYLETRSEHVHTSLQTVQGAVSYIKDHPYEDHSIETLAIRCRLSSRRFTDLVKKITGKTFSTYLNSQRIQYACQRLDETNHIIYACHESGFNDLSYFYRVFKKVTGRTPGQYIQEKG